MTVLTHLVVNKNIKRKKKEFQIISFIIFSDFLMFNQIFLSPQVKRWAIITYKLCIYELPHNWPNGVGHRILGNKEISRKRLNLIE